MPYILCDLSHLDPFQRWTLIIAAVMTILYTVMRPMRRKKDPLARKPGSLSLAGQREVEKQMSELLVELEQMARQMTAQLDTRAAKLELLLKEADERIALLQSGGAPTLRIDSHLVAPAPSIPNIETGRHAEVYELADQGLNAHEIARQLDRPYGEIELILALRDEPARQLNP